MIVKNVYDLFTGYYQAGNTKLHDGIIQLACLEVCVHYQPSWINNNAHMVMTAKICNKNDNAHSLLKKVIHQ